MNHEQIRDNHFARLNDYRNSVEYAEYAKSIGGEVPQGDLPCLIGDKWPIDAEIYDEFLGMLPPLGWRGGSFYMSEFTFNDITAKFSKIGDNYYCEFARYPERAVGTTITETPWGAAQSSREIAPGIVRHDTASHGGYWLSPERVASMPKPLQEFKPWAGNNWYEEDCDWSVVALAFPQFFSQDEVSSALATMKGYKPELFAALVADKAGVKQASGGRSV